jgi:hypothetical protein
VSKPKSTKPKSPYNKAWILEVGIPIIESYGGNLTIRSLYYRLVANGMTNDELHYKRVCNAMKDARWEGSVEFDAFLDHERESIGYTKFRVTEVMDEVSTAVRQINAWANSYSKNRWENQPNYVEVFIEKKALQGVFIKPCQDYDVALNPCKGYPSLTFLNDTKKRFESAIYNGKNPIILYFGDYDCSGEDIPRSIQDNLERMGVDVEVRRIALMEHQVVEWQLPPAPSKTTDSRSANWDGLGQVELDAVEPEKIAQLCIDAIETCFDRDLYNDLLEIERQEAIVFKSEVLANIKENFN